MKQKKDFSKVVNNFESLGNRKLRSGYDTDANIMFFYKIVLEQLNFMSGLMYQMTCDMKNLSKQNVNVFLRKIEKVERELDFYVKNYPKD